MIKAVIFDLAEVYLQGFIGIEEKLKPIVESSEERIDYAVQGRPLILLFKGEITEEDYWKIVKEKGRWEVPVEYFQRAVRGNFIEIEGTRKILKNISKSEYQMGLISDHAKEWIEYCEGKFDYHKLFDEIVYSFQDEVRALKSEKKPFEVMLEKLEIEPQHGLFIDDLKQNVRVAEEVGLQVLQFESVEQLSSDLLVKYEINL